MMDNRYTLILFVLLMWAIPRLIWGQGQDTVSYSGYRLYVEKAEVLKDKKKKFTISLRLVNTGSKALTASTKSEYMQQLVYVEDGAFQAVHKEMYADLIWNKLKKFKRYKMQPGAAQKIQLNIKIPKERRMGEDDFFVNTPTESAPDYSDKLCSDLIVDSLVLVERAFKYAIVEFQIKNIGKGAVNIIGDKKDKRDNVAVGAYFSGTKKYSKGAILAQTQYLEGLNDTQGILFPGDSMSVQMKVSRKKQSNYTKVIIIKVDASSIIIECEEENNYQSVVLR